jgi:hypothetical protein
MMPIGKNFCTNSLRYQCKGVWSDLGWTDGDVGGEQRCSVARERQVAE